MELSRGVDDQRKIKFFGKKLLLLYNIICIYVYTNFIKFFIFFFPRSRARLINHGVIIPSSVFSSFYSHPPLGAVVLFNFFFPSLTRLYLYSKSIFDDDHLFLLFLVNPFARQINGSAFQRTYYITIYIFIICIY